MSLGEMEACLARIYVDEPFRRLFYLEPSKTLAEYLLTEQERAALQGIDRKMLEFFAGSLKSKRRKRVQRAYPILFRILGARMDRYYARYYQLHPAKPNHSGQQDPADFGAFMEETLARAEDAPPYAADVARYERHCHGMSLAPAPGAPGAPDARDDQRDGHVLGPTATPYLREGVQVVHFDHDVIAIEKALEDGGDEGAPSPERSPQTLVFRPATPTAEVRMMRLNTPSKVVLDLCDGRRAVSRIVTETQAILGVGAAEDRIVETLHRLLALQVLAVGAGQASVEPRAYGATLSESL